MAVCEQELRCSRLLPVPALGIAGRSLPLPQPSSSESKRSAVLQGRGDGGVW